MKVDWCAALVEFQSINPGVVVMEIVGLGYSLNKIAGELDVDHKSVRNWRDGEWKPSAENLLKLLAMRALLRAELAASPSHLL